MVKSRLDQYKGRLSPELIAEGMNAASGNAARLVEDADLLLGRERFPSAASLAILAIEEAGKIPIMRMMSVVQDDPKALKECWRNYRPHTKKNVSWQLPQLVTEGAPRLEDFYPLFDEDADHPFSIDHVKQIGFYTDCLGNANWSSPPDAIDKDLADTLVQIARLLVNSPETTSMEIELWIKHMKPHLVSGMVVDYEGTKQALRDWFADMQEHGLSDLRSGSIEAFLSDPHGDG